MSFIQLRCVVAVAVAGLVAIGSPARAQTAAPALIPVTYAIINPNASEWPVFIAKQQNFFRDEGLDVTIVTSGSPPNVMNAVATNGANLGDTGSDTAIAAIAHGLAVKIIAPIFTTIRSCSSCRRRSNRGRIYAARTWCSQRSKT